MSTFKNKNMIQYERTPRKIIIQLLTPPPKKEKKRINKTNNRYHTIKG